MQVLVFLLTLSLLILIHELGHFISAKIFKMEVEEFGIGFPPRIAKLFTWRGTLFSLNLLPIGGFVRIQGESYDPALEGEKNVFWERPRWQRAVVLLSGVLGNFLLGAILFGVVYSVMGVPTETGEVKIVGVAENSPATEVGMKEGDVVGGFETTEGLVEFIDENKGEEVGLLLKDSEGEREIRVTPRENPPEGEGSLGVLLSDIELKRLPWWQMPFKGVVVGIKEAYAWGREIASGLTGILVGAIRGEGVPEDVAGPVGIYKLSAQVNELGWLASLQFAGILSMNLMVLNILPIPALDGGRLVFLGLEMLIGKRRVNKIEGWVHGVGMILLLGLMLLVTIRDVGRLF
jgi:regulator of sigma E protease